MRYIKFFDQSTGYVPGSVPPRFDGPKTLIEATGDRGVLIVDGRLKPEHVSEIAQDECAKRKYQAWQVFEGESFTRAKAVSLVNYISTGKEDRTAFSAYYGA